MNAIFVYLCQLMFSLDLYSSSVEFHQIQFSRSLPTLNLIFLSVKCESNSICDLHLKAFYGHSGCNDFQPLMSVDFASWAENGGVEV